MLERRRWFTPKERETYRRRLALEREATGLLRAADRQQRKSLTPRAAKLEATPAMPGRLTLSDLPMLRRLGKVP
jgi:hypothetical protein